MALNRVVAPGADQGLFGRAAGKVVGIGLVHGAEVRRGRVLLGTPPAVVDAHHVVAHGSDLQKEPRRADGSSNLDGIPHPKAQDRRRGGAHRGLWRRARLPKARVLEVHGTVVGLAPRAGDQREGQAPVPRRHLAERGAPSGPRRADHDRLGHARATEARKELARQLDFSRSRGEPPGRAVCAGQLVLARRGRGPVQARGAELVPGKARGRQARGKGLLQSLLRPGILLAQAKS